MKFSISTAIAAAVSGTAAENSWTAWSSSKAPDAGSSGVSRTCPTVSIVVAATYTAYESTVNIFESTVTVPIPSKPASFTVEPVWADWTGSSAQIQETECILGKTTTSTSTTTISKTGVRTVTKSILFVGAQVTGSAEDAWAIWDPDKGDSIDNNNNNDEGPNYGSSNSFPKPDLNNNNGGAPGPDGGYSLKPGSIDNAGPGSSSSGGPGGYGSGSNGDIDISNAPASSNRGKTWNDNMWGGKGDGGLVLGSGDNVFHWEPAQPTVVEDIEAPEYTLRPDGTYGGLLEGNKDDNDGSSAGTDGNEGQDEDEDEVDGTPGPHNGDKPDHQGPNDAPGYPNVTKPTGNKSPSQNATVAQPGSEASNVTKPFELINDSNCNSGNDRSTWCGGLSIDTDYYIDYFGDADKGTAGATADDSKSGKNIVGDVVDGVADIVDDAAEVAADTVNKAGGLFSGKDKRTVSPFSGATCDYDLVIEEGTVNQDGKDIKTHVINSQNPGPTIECNWGDLVTINVHNLIPNNGTTIHWHGIRHIGTNDQDGVPGVTECALAPGESRTYTWRASSYGTGWYHSHWGFGMASIQGAIIIHGPATANYDLDAGPVMVSDTFGMSADAFGHINAHEGPRPVDNYLLNGKNTRPDLSAGQHPLWKVQSGKKYLFRIINSASQNAYSLSIDGHKMKVIAADFVPIVPYETEWLNIGNGQRYDIVVEMNQEIGSYHFRAVTQLGCPSRSANSGLGQANGIIAYEGASENPLLLPTSTINGGKTGADFGFCADEPIASLVPHLKKDAGSLSKFQSSVKTMPGGKVEKIQTTDDGQVYRWYLNNGAMYINYTQPTLMSLDEGKSLNSTFYANPIVLRQKNEWVYFIVQNEYVAAHPMHLHGHDFSVLGQGDGVFSDGMVSTLNFDNPIRRDTAMLKARGYTIIGFETDNPGAWLMHCHIAWHVDGGLSLQWIERPDEMKPSGYTSDAESKDECQAYAAYEAANPAGRKTSGQSGLKRDVSYLDEVGSVVRRSEHAHHYFDSYMKSGLLGDGALRRTFGRRR